MEICWAILGHSWAILGLFLQFWVIFKPLWDIVGHFWAKLRKICGKSKFFCGIVGVAILAFRLYGDDDTFDIRMRWYVAFDMRWCVGDAVHLVRGDAWYVGDAGGDAFQPPPCQVPASHIHGLPRSTYLNTITKCKSKSTKVQIANTNANTEIQGGALGNAYLSSGCQLPASHNVQPRSATYRPDDLFQS